MGLKSTINNEKDMMLMEAASQAKHLVIPQTCLSLSKGLKDISKLTSLGYTNHVLAVVAPLEDCKVRGFAREAVTGKRYQPLEFEQSISAIPDVIRSANGRFEIVVATVDGGDGKHSMKSRTIASGNCGQHPSQDSSESQINTPSTVEIASLGSVIENAISPCTSG